MKSAAVRTIDVLVVVGTTAYAITGLCCVYMMWRLRRQFFIALRQARRARMSLPIFLYIADTVGASYRLKTDVSPTFPSRLPFCKTTTIFPTIPSLTSLCRFVCRSPLLGCLIGATTTLRSWAGSCYLLTLYDWHYEGENEATIRLAGAFRIIFSPASLVRAIRKGAID